MCSYRPYRHWTLSLFIYINSCYNAWCNHCMMLPVTYSYTATNTHLRLMIFSSDNLPFTWLLWATCMGTGCNSLYYTIPLGIWRKTHMLKLTENFSRVPWLKFGLPIFFCWYIDSDIKGFKFVNSFWWYNNLNSMIFCLTQLLLPQ